MNRPELAVWYGSMPESNGKHNYTAILYRKDEGVYDGITIDRSEYPDRVRYEADRMRFLIGEITEEPDILAYDANKHSGYVKSYPALPYEREVPEEELNAALKLHGLKTEGHSQLSDAFRAGFKYSRRTDKKENV
jgi:hypothetical protein